MTMTRQHFALIAECIRSMHDSVHVERDGKQTERVAERIREVLRSTNPNFNRARFLRACGVEG